MIKTGIKSFISGILTNKSKKVDIVNAGVYEDLQCNIALQAYAIQIVAGLIATLISKCEIKTFRNGKPFKGLEWHLLNIRPNANQSASEFWCEVIKKYLVSGDALIIQSGENLICADYFSIEKFAINEWQFSNIQKESMSFRKTWSMNEVMYLNYNNGRVAMILGTLLDEYNKLLQLTANRYEWIGGQKGVLEVPGQARSMPSFETDFAKLMNEYFKDYFNNKNAIVPLFGGMKYTPQSTADSKRNTSELTDYTNMLSDAITKTALAYNIAPALLKGDANGLNEAVSQTLTTAIDPIAKALSQEISAKRYTRNEVISGNYAKVCTDNIKHIDIFDIAANIDKLIASSFINVDEAREKAGIEATGEKWAKEYVRTKNYDTVENLNKGGANT